MFEHIRDYYTMLYCNMTAGDARLAVIIKLNDYCEDDKS